MRWDEDGGGEPTARLSEPSGSQRAYQAVILEAKAEIERGGILVMAEGRAWRKMSASRPGSRLKGGVGAMGTGLRSGMVGQESLVDEWERGAPVWRGPGGMAHPGPGMTGAGGFEAGAGSPAFRPVAGRPCRP
jgi:hypothetical protein